MKFDDQDMSNAKEQGSLLPCPFCGSAALAFEGEAGFGIRCIKPRCFLDELFDGYTSADSAAEAWNTRENKFEADSLPSEKEN